MRNSDRWLTPWTAVAIVAIVAVTVLGIAAGLVYLASIGRDPSPVLDMITKVGTAAGALTAAGATLIAGARTAKVERNTGVLASAVYEVADAMPQRVPRHSDPADDATVFAPAYKAAPTPQGR